MEQCQTVKVRSITIWFLFFVVPSIVFVSLNRVQDQFFRFAENMAAEVRFVRPFSSLSKTVHA
jgi:hypothetical protein